MNLPEDTSGLSGLLTQRDLTQRWRISGRTIERWRLLGRGPQFCRIGRQIRYRPCDVYSYEMERLNLVSAHDENGRSS